jgi:hypothetical protein
MTENKFGCLSNEALESWDWHARASASELRVVPVIAAWSDVCGFGKVLEECRCELDTLRSSGAFRALSAARILHGVPLFVGVQPDPSERVLIINDGVARTLDIENLAHIDSIRVIFYVRDLIFKHYAVLDMLASHGLGLRTVLAAGERCQYAPSRMTGESLLTYTGTPSEIGRAILAQQFVYNPEEFQMNTAFAMAYSLDAIGTRGSLVPNHIYAERGWLEALNRFAPGLLKSGRESAQFFLRGASALSLRWDASFSVECLGRSVEVLRLSEMTIHQSLEGEEVSVPLQVQQRNGIINPKRN